MKEVNEKHLVLEYDEASRCIIQTWKGFSGSVKFREGVEKTNQLFKKNNPTKKFIVDATEAAVVAQEDTIWAAKTAIPIAIQNGLKYYALVVPKNVFSQLSLQNFRNMLNQPSLEVQLFDDLLKAKNWIQDK